MVDWDLAARIGAQVAGPGPQMSLPGGRVGRRRAAPGCAERSGPLVREFTGLTAEERTAPVLVVDRPGWIQANVDAFGTVFEPIIAKVQERSGIPLRRSPARSGPG